MFKKLVNIINKSTEAAGKLGSSFSKIKNTVTSVTCDIGQKAADVFDSNDNSEQGVLNSIDAIKKWLTQLQGKASPAALRVIQAELKVLSFIQSPAMSGITIENLIFLLDKSLKMKKDDQEGEMIRDSFCSMTQIIMLITEARMLLTIQNKKEESISILTYTGDILSESIINVGFLAGGVEAISNVTCNNIFSAQEKDGFFKKLTSWITNKSDLQSKKEEYYLSLENMYRIFDRYFPLIGPNILIYGILERYRPIIVNYRKEEALLPSKSKNNDNKDHNKSAAVINKVVNVAATAYTVYSGGGISGIGDLFSSGGASDIGLLDDMKILGSLSGHTNVVNKKTSNSVEDADNNSPLKKNSIILKEELSEFEQKKEKTDNRISRINEELSDCTKQLEKTAIFKISERSRLKGRIDNLTIELNKTQMEADKIEKSIQSTRKELTSVSAYEDKFRIFEEELKRIADKYAVC